MKHGRLFATGEASKKKHLAAILPPLLVAPPVMGKQLHNFATTTHRVHGAFYLPTFG